MILTIHGTPRCCSAAEIGTKHAAYDSTYSYWGVSSSQGHKIDVDLETWEPQKTRFFHIQAQDVEDPKYVALKKNPNIEILFETNEFQYRNKPFIYLLFKAKK
jgi:hypothetical protein